MLAIYQGTSHRSVEAFYRSACVLIEERNVWFHRDVDPGTTQETRHGLATASGSTVEFTCLFETYGHIAQLNRATVFKYGRSALVETLEVEAG